MTYNIYVLNVSSNPSLDPHSHQLFKHDGNERYSLELDIIYC